MHSIWKTSIRFSIFTFLLFGLVYPLAITGIARITFPHRASGSLIVRDGQVVGSELLAQGFTSDRYFHPRPSAAGNGYDAANSGGSNLAQSNAVFVHRVQADVNRLSEENPGVPIPEDLVTTSASGLDPDITPDAAYYQAPRVAKTRGISVDAVRALIQKHTAGRQFGLLGEPRVKVLELNLALDELSGGKG